MENVKTNSRLQTLLGKVHKVSTRALDILRSQHERKLEEEVKGLRDELAFASAERDAANANRYALLGERDALLDERDEASATTQAQIARLYTALKAIADGDGANECAHDWPEFYDSVKRQARVAIRGVDIDTQADTEANARLIQERAALIEERDALIKERDEARKKLRELGADRDDVAVMNGNLIERIKAAEGWIRKLGGVENLAQVQASLNFVSAMYREFIWPWRQGRISGQASLSLIDQRARMAGLKQ